MAKKEQEQLVGNGKRIKGRKASADKYIPFYEFLLYDPTYREMKEKAKILYSFLRKKAAYFEERTEAYEMAIANGEESIGTKSFRDENDEIFCLADNAELSIILQCHYNRVPDFKKELKKYGLLDEVPQLNTANRLYILEPTNIAGSWTYIEDIKELRTKIKEENKAKFEKRKSKKQEKKTSETVHPDSNSQNVSCGNSQNVSYGNSQNVSKTKSKGFKSNLKSLNNNLNLSISEEIENTSLPINLKKLLINKIDRLIEFNINIIDVELHFYAVREKFTEPEYIFVLNNLIDKMTIKPKTFAAVMNDWLDRNHKKQNEFGEKKENKLKRTEMVPDWLNKENGEEQTKPEEATVISEERKKAIWEQVKKLKTNNQIS